MPDSTSPSDQGLHTTFIKNRLPDWIEHLTSYHIGAITRAMDPAQTFITNHPQLFAQAKPELRQALLDSQVRSRASSHALAKTLKDFKGITEFATSLLTEAMRNKFGITPDVNKTVLFHLRSPNRLDQITLLQAALRNFEVDESFDEVSLQETSALAAAGSLSVEYYGEPLDIHGTLAAKYIIRNKLPIQPASFARLCRTLDVGQRYQEHLSAVFDTTATAAQVRDQMIAANKDTLRVQAHIARIKSDISQTAHATLLEIVDGAPVPRLDGQPVIYSQLRLLGSDLNDVLIIGAASRNADTTMFDLLSVLSPKTMIFSKPPPDTRIVVYIPGDPLSPVKEYASLKALAADLAIKLRSADYQRFFTGLLSQEASANFFRRLKGQLKTFRWNPKPDLPAVYNVPGGLYEEVWNEDADLRPDETFFGTDVFGERYKLHVERLKSNARLLAVPVAEVDHQAWLERLEYYAEWGLNVLNVAAFIVPGLGEVMLAVTAVQLSLEVYHGIEAWEAGDAEEAWGHLQSVLLNVAFMAAVGVASSLPSILGSEMVNGLVRVKLPNGDIKLWKPDLGPYQSDTTLEGLKPNALGQYKIAGKTYIRQENSVYEKVFDSEAKKWRIKHPTDPEAYQPILQHNNLGAWRHSLERPLAWSRSTLLRRMGHVTDGFSDTALEQIADISGVSDDALRKMHVDCQPPPSLLAETLKQFRVDQEVDQLIEQVRIGKPIADNRYNFALPMMADMPRWPLNRVIEVFDGPGLEGKSIRFGSGAGAAKSTIKATRAQVSSSQLPALVLAGLDEPEIVGLLGDEGARVISERVAVFRAQIADFLKTQTVSVFGSIYKGIHPDIPELKVLQRNLPGLPVDAAQELLGTLSEPERVRLRDNQRMPLPLLEQSRWFVQQARLNRAFAGLYLDSLASVDSERLALHALEKLPGWSHQVRLEVRRGHVKGQLLDSIGSETAAERKYLVKQGSRFQAHDDHGNTLNSIPKYGRNFFASIMHTLPDGVREDLGLPHASFSPELQKALARYAVGNRGEMSRVLGQQPIKPRFRPPQVGYSAYLLSGRGGGMVVEPSLIARARDLYPSFTDEQAEEFIRNQYLSGRTPQHVFTVLNNEARELAGLQTTLEQWVADEQAPAIAWRVSRRVLADRLIKSWRFKYSDEPRYSHLDLSGAGQLPPLMADFSHVTSLGLNSSDLTRSGGEAIFRQFRTVRRLDMWLEEGSGLPEAVIRNTAITELRLNGLRLPNQGLQQQLSSMVQLEMLNIGGELGSIDVSHLKQLRHLDLYAAQLHSWPVGVLELEYLESLDLRGNSISTLPEQFLSGHEHLWRGFSMDWESLDHETFMSVYGYLRGNVSHLANAEDVAEAYRRGCLRALLQDPLSGIQARVEGMSTETMLEQIKGLRQEFNVLTQRLDQWQQKIVRIDRQPADAHYRKAIAKRLMVCWRDGVRARYGETRLQVLRERLEEVLDLSGWGLGDLPGLPGVGYSHVRHLNLAGTKVPELAINAFLRKFPQLRQLNLSGNGLVELPSAVEELTHLTALHVNGNELRSTPALQLRLNRLSALEVLELRNNPLQALDVSAMTQLKMLDLSATALREWPAGLWDLQQLRTLYLNRSGVTSIPDAALHGHDPLVATTGLRGCLLTEEAFARRQVIVERYYASIGRSPAAALDRSQWGGPQYFPPVESVESIAANLLPVLPAQSSGQVMSPVAHLRGLDPGMGEVEASQIIEKLREQGLGPLEVDTRISAWRQEHAALTSTLNEWINISGYNVADVRVTAVTRRRAADAILGSWREEIRVRTSQQIPEEGGVLDLGGMPLGDLPALPGLLPHIRTLNVRGVKLSEQGSNAFLRAFPNLSRLVLDNNELDLLPEAVTGMHNLTRLEVVGNYLSMSDDLQRQLNSLANLEWLDLRDNNLDALDVQALPRLRTLDLRDNGFIDWPSGALQSPTLRTLNLADNAINSVSAEALRGRDVLMRGTNLSGNDLSREEFAIIRNYFEQSGNGLGYTAEELDALIDSSSEESDSSGEEIDSEGQEEQRARWLAGTQGEMAKKQALWDALQGQEDSRNFFHLLSELKHSKDFIQNRADLTRRVWQVLEAASGDEKLRKELFVRAEAGYTCGDGRILAFSDLEVKVLEFNALASAAEGQEGRELLRLARGLFRLEEVERVARESIARSPGIDPAEVRLAYRIGLAQRLELPGQPTGMLYANLAKVSPDDLNAAYSEIVQAEQTPEFMTQLVGREYWVDYLKRKYPVEFALVQQRREVKLEALEEQHPTFTEAYLSDVKALDTETKAQELQLTLSLSQRERSEIAL